MLGRCKSASDLTKLGILYEPSGEIKGLLRDARNQIKLIRDLDAKEKKLAKLQEANYSEKNARDQDSTLKRIKEHGQKIAEGVERFLGEEAQRVVADYLDNQSRAIGALSEVGFKELGTVLADKLAEGYEKAVSDFQSLANQSLEYLLDPDSQDSNEDAAAMFLGNALAEFRRVLPESSKTD